MKVYACETIARGAVSNTPDRPAAALAHDHDDARMIVFRIEPGQHVPVHTTVSSVFLTVISGRGFVTDGSGEREVSAGDVIAYEPQEPHGIRADTERLVISALISPRPGSR
ncbi:MAG: cupin domain-containing protein [Gemmatimonadota bacterium]|nr:cupin domain-containing protein [Gemmatimonadota bacterium]